MESLEISETFKKVIIDNYNYIHLVIKERKINPLHTIDFIQFLYFTYYNYGSKSRPFEVVIQQAFIDFIKKCKFYNSKFNYDLRLSEILNDLYEKVLLFSSSKFVRNNNIESKATIKRGFVCLLIIMNFINLELFLKKKYEPQDEMLTTKCECMECKKNWLN